MPHPLVVHCKRSNFDVYVGRKSRGAPPNATGEWGNPFAMKHPYDEAERQRVIRKYEAWLMQQPALVQKAKRELRGKVLACWCAPKACHADVLARLVNKDNNDDEDESSQTESTCQGIDTEATPNTKQMTRQAATVESLSSSSATVGSPRGEVTSAESKKRRRRNRGRKKPSSNKKHDLNPYNHNKSPATNESSKSS